MIYPVSSDAGFWLNGGKRPHLSLLDDRFKAGWLAQAPFTVARKLGQSEVLVPQWMQGVEFFEAGMQLPEDPDGCCTPVQPQLRAARAGVPATDTEKETQDIGPITKALPFEIVAGTVGSIPGTGEEYPEFGHARNLFSINNWMAPLFAQALLDNPTPTQTAPDGNFDGMTLLTTTACLVSSGASVLHAFAAVDGALTHLLGDEQGMIHVSPLTLSWLSLTSGLRLDPIEGYPLSPNGHWIISEPTYADLPGPDGAVAAEGTEYIWGTPIVQWFSTNAYNPGALDPATWGFQRDVPLFDSTKNKMYAFDEIWGILIVRPCAVVAIGGLPREV